MIRRLARCIREYKWAAILSPICMVGEVTMEVIIPLVMASLYNYGVEMQNMQIVATRSVQLVLCAVASLLFGAVDYEALVLKDGFDPKLVCVFRNLQGGFNAPVKRILHFFNRLFFQAEGYRMM